MKKTSITLRLKILATKATPKPPIGPILGQYSINLMEFCKEFNARSSQLYKPNKGTHGIIVPTVVKIREDKSYSNELKPLSVSGMLELLGQVKFTTPRRKKVIDARIIYEIAKIRLINKGQEPDHILNECLTIKGTIKSMGYKIIGPKDL